MDIKAWSLFENFKLSELNANFSEIANKTINGDSNYGGTVSTNLNAITKTGFYTCYGTATGAPSTSYSWFIEHINSNAGTVSAYQRAVAYSTSLLVYERTKQSGTWGTWKNSVDEILNTKTSNCILEMPTKPTYSGLTVTVYAGTKVLMPNGRNTNGTLKNTDYMVPSTINSSSMPTNSTVYVYLVSNGACFGALTSKVSFVNKFSELPPSPSAGDRSYCEETNLWYYVSGSSWVAEPIPRTIVATAVIEASAITSLTPYNVLKYVDTSMINELTTTIYETPTANAGVLGTISTHKVMRNGGSVRYSLDAITGTWTANSTYTVCTLKSSYIPTIPFKKYINLRVDNNVAVKCFLNIATNGTVNITPRSEISGLSIYVDETFII